MMIVEHVNKVMIVEHEMFTNIHELRAHAVQMLCKGLKELGILKNDCTSRDYYQLNPTSIRYLTLMSVHYASEILKFLYVEVFFFM